MNKEIEIPEGYEAKIEGNKVVLIQKESEEEKIRKEIIKFLTYGLWSKTAIDKVKQLQEYAKWIAYIEKHTESTWTEEDESFVTHILPRILEPDKWTFDQISADKKYLIEFIKRQKRKFTKKELSEEDENNINKLLAICSGAKNYREFAGCDQKCITKLQTWLKSLSPRHNWKPNWKPSYLQMTALYDAIYKCTLPNTLKSLYDDLEKLM